VDGGKRKAVFFYFPLKTWKSRDPEMVPSSAKGFPQRKKRLNIPPRSNGYYGNVQFFSASFST
jgi:hypothetical protein